MIELQYILFAICWTMQWVFLKKEWVSYACKHLRWTSGLTSQYSVIISLKYLESFYIHATSITWIYSVYFIFWVALLFLNLVIISLQFAYRNMFSRFCSFIPTDDQINLGTLIDIWKSQTVYLMKEPKILISIQVLNSI